MSPGLSFRYTMSGSYWLLDAPTDERSLDVTFAATAADLRRFAIDKTWLVRGTLTAERLATAKPIEGTLIFRILEEGRIPCRWTFRGDDGRKYELSGQIEWRGVAPIESMTHLPATLYDDAGDELGRATLRFDWRADGMNLVKSFRVHLGG